MGQPVVHFEVVGKDAGALREYYGQLFGWEFDADNPMDYGIVERDQNLSPEGIGIGGGVGSAGPEAESGHLTFYVGVDDVGEALERAEKLGGTRVMGPMDVPNGPAIALFRDPEGNMMGLVRP